MAPHIIDLPYWALDLGLPLKTSCCGGRYVLEDDGDCPDVQEVLWQYPNMTMTHMMTMVNSYGWDFGKGTRARRIGMYLHGVNGTLYADYGICTITAEGDFLKETRPAELKELEEPLKSLSPGARHVREWLDCIRTRKQPSTSISYHYRIGMAIALANLSWKLGRTVQVDPATEKIVGDDEAARLAKPQYRAPWKFPDQYL
jgi:predicted dehydrogenase